MAAWVSPPLTLFSPATPIIPSSLRPAPPASQNVSNSQIALALAVEQSGSAAAEHPVRQRGNVHNPLGERRQSAVKALRARETNSQTGTPTMNEAYKAVERSRVELGPVAATNIAQDYAIHVCMRIYIHVCITHMHMHKCVYVCVCVYT